MPRVKGGASYGVTKSVNFCELWQFGPTGRLNADIHKTEINGRAVFVSVRDKML